MSFGVALRSTKTASVDYLRSPSAKVSIQILSILGFAALTALGSQFRLYLWEVPFTLQTLAVYGSGLFLGWRNGMLSQVAYLALGMVLPVYAGGEIGFAYIMASASAGYLLAFPVAAALAGWVSKTYNSPTGSIISCLVGSAIIFTCGVTVLHFVAGHETWIESVQRGWLPFAAIDLAKIIGVALVYSAARRIRF